MPYDVTWLRKTMTIPAINDAGWGIAVQLGNIRGASFSGSSAGYHFRVILSAINQIQLTAGS